MTPLKNKTAALVAAAAMSGLILGGTSIANAAGTSPSGSSSSAPAQGGRPAPHDHSAVTGDELTQVSDAVKAKVSGIAIVSVEKDPDGSYDVAGTVNGVPTMYDVSADLATITERVGEPGGPGGRGPGGPGGPGFPGGPGAHDHTAVTGDALASVKAAVTAKFADLTVVDVRQDPDGSYDVFATTSSGQPTMVEVSKDLTSVTQRTDGPPAPPAPPTGGAVTPGATPSGKPSAQPSDAPSDAPSTQPTAPASAAANSSTQAAPQTKGKAKPHRTGKAAKAAKTAKTTQTSKARQS